MLWVSSNVRAPGPRGRERSLGSGVATTDNDDVE